MGSSVSCAEGWLCLGCWTWNTILVPLLGKKKCTECTMEVPVVGTVSRQAEVLSIVTANPLVVFSKTFCPHCKRAKALPKRLHLPVMSCCGFHCYHRLRPGRGWRSDVVGSIDELVLLGLWVPHLQRACVVDTVGGYCYHGFFLKSALPLPSLPQPFPPRLAFAFPTRSFFGVGGHLLSIITDLQLCFPSLLHPLAELGAHPLTVELDNTEDKDGYQDVFKGLFFLTCIHSSKHSWGRT